MTEKNKIEPLVQETVEPLVQETVDRNKEVLLTLTAAALTGMLSRQDKNVTDVVKAIKYAEFLHDELGW